MTKKRVVCLNCIDGRVQLPVIHWIKNNYDADYVDMITELGIDGLLADNDPIVGDIIRKIRISVEKNNSELIFVAGHHDCRANPVSDSAHQDQIYLAVARLKKEFPKMDIIGLWVNKEWEGEVIES